MSTATLPTTDLHIRDAVQQELSWTPDVPDARIGVAVFEGTVTLSGQIDDHAARRAAIRAALRVSGVTTVVDDLLVHPTSYVWTITETEIAENVQRALAVVAGVPDAVRATVKDHTVTLTGQVPWDYQRVNAARAVGNLRGITHVVDEITLTARPMATDAEDRIRAAFLRYASIDAHRVHVSVTGTTATLTGRVRSYSERQQAVRSTWASPHIAHVVDEMTIEA